MILEKMVELQILLNLQEKGTFKDPPIEYDKINDRFLLLLGEFLEPYIKTSINNAEKSD